MKEGEIRVMEGSDERMQSDSSNSSCMHDWYMPQREREVASKGSIQPHSMYIRTIQSQCNADGPAGSCWFVKEGENTSKNG